MKNKYDIVIKAHKKDYYKLDLVVESIKYLNPQPEEIYILTPDGFYPKNTSYDDKIIYIKDSEVTPFIDRNKLNHRPNWNWINLVSILQSFTKNDLYFDIQADNFFTKEINLFDENGKPKLFQSISNSGNNIGHRPYFEFSEKVFNIPKNGYGYSYIVEFMMYDRKLLKIIIDKYSTFEELMNIIYSNVNEKSYPADQEIFGNLVEKYFPEKYNFVKNVNVDIRGSYLYPASREEIISAIEEVKKYKTDCLACSYHTWI